MKTKSRLLAFAALTLVAVPALADDAFANFSGPYSADAFAFPSNALSFAFRFVPTLTGTVTSVTLPLFATGATARAFSLSFADPSVVTRFPYGNPLGSVGGLAAPWTGSTNAPPTVAVPTATATSLVAGRSYNLVVSYVPNSASSFRWQTVAAPFPVSYSYQYSDSEYGLRPIRGGGTANFPAAFSIQVAPNAAPEPSPLAALAFGAVALSRRRLRRA